VVAAGRVGSVEPAAIRAVNELPEWLYRPMLLFQNLGVLAMPLVVAVGALAPGRRAGTGLTACRRRRRRRQRVGAPRSPSGRGPCASVTRPSRCRSARPSGAARPGTSGTPAKTSTRSWRPAGGRRMPGRMHRLFAVVLGHARGHPGIRGRVVGADLASRLDLVGDDDEATLPGAPQPRSTGPTRPLTNLVERGRLARCANEGLRAAVGGVPWVLRGGVPSL